MRYIVATGHPLASQAALRILEEGGSAVDAAIAADAVLGVVEPMPTSIGGDLLAMVVEYDATVVAYNGTGRAPRAFRDDLLQPFASRRIPERHGLSVTTPGAVQGWHDLNACYGRVPFERLLSDAIEVARSGFAVAPVCAREWALFDRVLHDDPACAALYRAGHPPRAGERFHNPQLASVLGAIAREGPRAFYEGEPARAAEVAIRAHGGVLAAQDFRAPSR